ncbi:MAG: D-alanyl-D-alanine carboxypeptidase family protein [Cyanobacteria bacterium P01_A01_bin.83]
MEDMEIPEAIRESTELPPKSPLLSAIPLLIGITFCFGAIGLGLWGVFSLKKQSLPPTVQPTQPKPATTEPQQPQPAPEKITTAPSKKIDLLGHLPYSEAPESELSSIGGNLQLRTSAAAKFKEMQAAAKAEGINLVAVSAFRNADIQEELFFGIKEQRGQDATKRAEVSAPPGYSEHHTGYAVDIGDGDAPSTHLETNFAQTAVFAWLEQNALKYSFELSFPADNKQGVSYEPWHWRFVGDRHSLETFYKIRN